MPTTESSRPSLDRILVVRLGSLGDLVHTLPAVSAIRRAHPRAEIDWLVEPPHREFLDLVPIVSNVVVLAGRSIGGWRRTASALRARHYDAAIDFQGLVKSAVLARASGARRVLGFDRGALRERAAAFFYKECIRVGEGRHVIDKNLALASAIGAATNIVDFPIRDVASPALGDVRARVGERFALLNCGAAWPNKRWPPDRFGALAVWLRDAHGLASVVLWGPGEREIADAIVRASSGAALAAPETRLTDLVALAQTARLVVSGDTGPTHIAEAVGAPLVALFGPTDPHRNGPWIPADRAISRYDACQCHYQRHCRLSAAEWCLGRITEADVRAAVDERLGTADSSS
ncbi:MAG TPA: lipopolysaccharide heptosyltransferase I [Vicinamibacterales bacterium]|nr:lipopolysaccharide heptosyltransferase I [Vicinamibacterales bacterium]